MQLVLDYNTDHIIGNIGSSSVLWAHKRAVHLSHFLYVQIPTGGEAFDLLLEEDKGHPTEPINSEELLSEDWHLPALLEITESMQAIKSLSKPKVEKQIQKTDSIAYSPAFDQAIVENIVAVCVATDELLKKQESVNVDPHLRQAKPRHLIAEQAAAATVSYNSTTHVEAKTQESLVRVFSSASLDETPDCVEKSGFLEWIKARNYSRIHEQETPDIIQPEESSSQKGTTSKHDEEQLKNRKVAEKKLPPQESTEVASPDVNTSSDDKSLKHIVRESISLGDEVASETLAELLALHGHKNRAVKMYNRLRLLFPEKSSYFALKIQELNKS